MLTGKVKWFSPKKNYGFIIPNQARSDRKEIFFYGDEFSGDPSSLKTEMWVAYSEVIETSRGPRAEGVNLCKKRGEHERSAAREREPAKMLPFGTD